MVIEDNMRTQFIKEQVLDKVPNPIHVEVRECEDSGCTYYLATSSDVPGFLCEGETLDDIKNNTPYIITDLLCAKAERFNRAFDFAQQIAYYFVDKNPHLQCVAH
ncbi:MAG: hypothetical protein CR971_00655 [candidate division SR1 bacterium]|nr:MAG: hypothetical protein CR971_00655 [candidate division SR1 bacterium]